MQEQTLKRYVTQKRLQVDVDNTREVLEAEISKHFATVVRCPKAWTPQTVFLTVVGTAAEKEMLLFGTTRCVPICAPSRVIHAKCSSALSCVCCANGQHLCAGGTGGIAGHI